MQPPDKPRKGRGAISNPALRYASTRVERFDDGWDTDPEELPPLETVVRPDPARTIIARNNSPDLHFTQSINPYRGCEHGCVYCLSGETPILMADGRTRALADVRSGDWIYGTARHGGYRRYVRTRVLAHWSVIRPAFRLTLDDGTTLVAGGDHRFLTDRGWKYVRDSRFPRRPHLATGNKLMGSGAFAAPVPKAREYKLGYLCGMIRGDALLRSYHYGRPGRAHGDQHRFRHAPCDSEGLQRTREYLRDAALDTQEFLFRKVAQGRPAIYGIRTSAPAGVERIRTLIEWPASPTPEWRAGFLAGVFDAEGCFSQGVLRISNTDSAIIEWITRCLQHFSFALLVEHPKRSASKPSAAVRVMGGLREHLRFFHLFDPAISRKQDIEGLALKSAARLRVVGVEPEASAMRLYDITTGTEDFIANGVVSHNCFARPTHAYLDLSPGLDFETKLFYKENAAELLTNELAHPRYECSPITLGANTDPYQPIERKLGVTRSLIEVLARAHHPMTIVTKSALVLRDLELLAEMAQSRLVAVMVSITSLDDETKRTLEPRTASPARRLQVVRTLSEAGVPVGVLVAPIIPLVTDHELEEILERAAAAGARTAGYVLLRMPHEIKHLFEEWLRAHAPLKAEHVMSLMRQMHGGREYDSTWGHRQRGSGPYAQLLARRFELACERAGFGSREAFELDTTLFRPPALGGQLDLGF